MKKDCTAEIVKPINGQTSIFDLLPVKEEIEEIKKETLTDSESISIENSGTNIKIEKVENLDCLTEQQQQYITKEDILNNKDVSKIIIHSKGSISIEYKMDDIYKSDYIDKSGKLNFTYDNKTTIMPWDKIYYYANEIPCTDIQIQIVKELKEKFTNIIKIIKRKGDEKIFILFENKIIGITSDGIKLPFNSININYTENEVLK